MVLVTPDTTHYGGSISMDTPVEKKSTKEVWDNECYKTT